MNVSVIQPPPFAPVNLRRVYDHLRLDPEESPETHPDDDMLTQHIEAATKDAQDFTHRAFVQQTLRLSRGGFPSGGCGVELLRAPVVRIESVRYFDAANALQVVEPSDYYLSDDVAPQLRFVTGFAKPTVYDRPDALRVDFVAGYATDGSPAETQEDYAANVPEQIKQAILLGVELLYGELSPQDHALVERTRNWLLSSHVLQIAV